MEKAIKILDEMREANTKEMIVLAFEYTRKASSINMSHVKEKFDSLEMQNICLEKAIDELLMAGE